jgi:hypothetical protein
MQKVLDGHAIQLYEHFDSVRIIVTKFRPDSDDTICGGSGAGDFYAQLGAARDWLATNDSRTRHEARR